MSARPRTSAAHLVPLEDPERFHGFVERFS